MGKRDQRLESSLSLGGDLYTDIRNLVSYPQISPVDNAIRDKIVFEKGWKQRYPLMYSVRMFLGPFRECWFPWSSVQV